MEHVVLALGGSIVAPGKPDAAFAARLARMLDEHSRKRRILVVVGGGKSARDAIGMAREAGASEEVLDRIGIQATRLNAQLLIGFLAARKAQVHPDVPPTTAQAAMMAQHHRIVVMGGTTPGHSTDYVGVELAHAAQARRFVIATNVEGVYDRDPRRHKDAKRIDRLDFDQLVELLGTEWEKAGQTGVVDGPATRLLQRHRTETRVLHGADLENLGKALTGDTFEGTLIVEAA